MMHPCPVERLQAGWMGRQGFTTRDHGWPKGVSPAAATCKFCGQTRQQAASVEHGLLVRIPAAR